ncbi:MAG: sulfotransferase [Deltaproteobacteria bacterium]|nr:sulfotransferase [Deltaproteobacteria bacterium]MBW2363176.1 sulfotransferase [Deltaproteobacteria bacterium]
MSFELNAFPLPARALLASWRAAARVGVGRVSLSEESLIRAARRSAGLHDFVDGSFREPMRRMLHSLEAEGALHPLGRVTIRESLVRALVNRLRLEDLCDRHSQIAETPVAKPVFVVGLQRTGTTMLQRMLTCEPRLRAMPAWEGLNPAPFPKRLDRHGRDPRIRLAKTAERALRYLSPELFAVHPVEAEEPEEDIHLLDVSFVSPAIDAIARVPSYQAWFREVDQLPAYRYMRRLIQLLLWQRGGRWLGKTPHHLEYLDELLAVFPDAKVIITHRDPARSVASFCSMMAHSRALFSDRVDPVEIGEQFSSKAIRAVERSMQARQRIHPSAFLDVIYQDVVADPLKEVRRVYDFIGFELEAETEATMQHWLRNNSQTKHGVHDYRLEDFGLDRERLAPHFEAYRFRYGIPTEA